MNVTCSAESCPVILNSICVFYEGDTLLYTGIVQNDNIQTALQKIDAKFHDAGIGYAFTNGISQSAPGDPVKLGGILTEDTTITSNGKQLYITGNLKSGAFITQGGTSAQFVKGDGTLDGTSYQPVGNYITDLTGDGIANGPGAAILTLASVNSSPGTWGTNGTVPRITVNAKGLITAVSSVAINYPEKSLSFGGDISGLGFTGSLVTLTLPIINSDVFGTNTFLKFGVNGKGLVTSAAAVTHLDIESVLGYVPVTSDRTITINGVTYDLTANRSWTIAGSAGTSGTSGTSGSGGGGTGTSGSSGNSGTSGVSGTSGTSGTSGSTGTSGTSGTSGSTGTSGTSGNSGTSGTSGNGTSGTSGSTGTSGTSGQIDYTPLIMIGGTI